MPIKQETLLACILALIFWWRAVCTQKIDIFLSFVVQWVSMKKPYIHHTVLCIRRRSIVFLYIFTLLHGTYSHVHWLEKGIACYVMGNFESA